MTLFPRICLLSIALSLTGCVPSNYKKEDTLGSDSSPTSEITAFVRPKFIEEENLVEVFVQLRDSALAFVDNSPTVPRDYRIQLIRDTEASATLAEFTLHAKPSSTMTPNLSSFDPDNNPEFKWSWSNEMGKLDIDMPVLALRGSFFCPNGEFTSTYRVDAFVGTVENPYIVDIRSIINRHPTMELPCEAMLETKIDDLKTFDKSLVISGEIGPGLANPGDIWLDANYTPVVEFKRFYFNIEEN